MHPSRFQTIVGIGVGLAVTSVLGLVYAPPPPSSSVPAIGVAMAADLLPAGGASRPWPQSVRPQTASAPTSVPLSPSGVTPDETAPPLPRDPGPAQRAADGDPLPRADQSGRSNKSAKPPKPDKVEKRDRPAKPDKAKKRDRPAKRDKRDKPEKRDQLEKRDKPEK